MTDEDDLNEIEKLRNQLDDVRDRLYAKIRAVFPENRGEPPIRGRLAEVARRARWSREHIANIRDGKIKE
ncbi:hypothetical protein ACQP2K_39650 [Microbispora siamensis]